MDVMKSLVISISSVKDITNILLIKDIIHHIHIIFKAVVNWINVGIWASKSYRKRTKFIPLSCGLCPTEETKKLITDCRVKWTYIYSNLEHGIYFFERT